MDNFKAEFTESQMLNLQMYLTGDSLGAGVLCWPYPDFFQNGQQ